MPSKLIAWYCGLHEVDPERTNPPEHLLRRERELAVSLPLVLRDVYLETSLRESQVLHLRLLDEVELRDGVLVFAREQQSCWSYGVETARLGESDPPIVADKEGVFVDDGVRLAEFIRAFALLNRPYEAPCITNTYYDTTLLRAPWRRLTLEWPDATGYELWTDGEAVLEARVGELGARNEEALERAARSLGILDGATALTAVDGFVACR